MPNFLSTLQKTWKPKTLGKILFVLLFASFVFMGVYNTYNYSVTLDEPAHLGAAESYRWHIGVNQEHPPLMKALNAVLIRVAFPNYQTITNNQYGKGSEFLWLSPYNPNLVLQTSRFVYLAFHSLIFAWFWYYVYHRKLINERFSLIFLTLLTFSPSVITINPLLIFDIAGALTAFTAVFSSVLLFFNFQTLTRKSLIFDTLVTSLVVSTALLSKFTNLYIVFVLIFIALATCAKYIKQGVFKNIWKRFVISILTITTFVLTSVWLIYTYAYGKIPYVFTTQTGLEKKILIPFFRMYDGAMSIYSYVQVTPKANFVDDRFTFITYQQFINRVFWFKENPILVLLLALATIFTIWFSTRHWSRLKAHLTTKNILISLSVALYPVMYFYLAKDKFFAIGFRHFLSIEVFILAGLAALVYFFTILKPQLKNWVSIVLILYSIFGVLALQKGVGYTNLYWNRPNWELANDSTIFLAEYQRKPLEYLNSIGKLKPNNDDGNITFIYRGHWITQQMTIYQITGSKDERYGSYNIGIDPMSQKITDSKATYLAVDIFWFQEILNNISTTDNQIARQNWQYLQNTKPIYNYQNAAFVYQLR